MSIVKSFSVGNGDMFYIKHDNDNFTIIDCCMTEEEMSDIVKELKNESKDKGVVRFISTHPDNDHIKGIKYLNEKIPIVNFYCVENKATKKDHTDDFNEYCTLRDSNKAFFLFKHCSRKWLNDNNDERGGSGINILWPITDNEDHIKELESVMDKGDSNNISPIIKFCSKDNTNILWMGDPKTDFMEKITDQVVIGSVDVLFAPHHGRDTGKVPGSWLKSMNPKIVIIGEAPSKHLNYYAGYNTITQNSAGDITLDCIPGKTHIYVSNPDYSVDFLDDENLQDIHGKYIGTLKV